MTKAYRVVSVRASRQATRRRGQQFAPISKLVRVSEEEAEREAIRFHEEWNADLKALEQRREACSEDTLHLPTTE